MIIMQISMALGTVVLYYGIMHIILVILELFLRHGGP